MALKFYKQPDLPSSPTVADNGIYYVKPNGNNPFRLYVIQAPNIYEIDAVTAAQLAAGLATKANDSDVVKLTGAQSISGVKTFNSSPVVPTATTNPQAVNKGQMDTADANLQSQIDALSTTVASGMQTPSDLDCSGNPNYPASDAGDTYIVTVAGKIGGASGEEVTVGDMIVCKETNAGGTQATVGSKFFIVQANINDGTETVKGYVQFTTDAEAIAGSLKTKAVHPSGLKAHVDAVAVKLTGNQTVAGKKTFSTVPASSQDASAATDLVRKSQMDTALATKANDGDVVKLTGIQTIAGIKTFNSSPVVPNATLATQAVNKGQLDSAVAAATIEWTTDNWA